MPELRLRWLWLAIGWLLVLLVLYLSLTPDPPEVGPPGSDKPSHLLAYAVLMLWFLQLYPVQRRVAIAIRLLVMGLLVELLQGYSGHRHLEFGDMAANVAGVAAGWLAGRTRLGESLLILERHLPAAGG